MVVLGAVRDKMFGMIAHWKNYNSSKYPKIIN